MSRSVFAVTIFSSAFLLFQVQLILGKFLLPWFGGTSAVWTSCLLFFQVFLLMGYLYAHKIATSFSFVQQARLHLAFLAIGAVGILLEWYFWRSPLLPGVEWKPVPESAPVIGILKLLLLSVGLPFLLLASTGPLLQNWYAQSYSLGKEPPYFLYALSNAGSLLGLISYPIFLEPFFPTSSQSMIWGAGFLFFVFCCAGCAWKVHSLRRSRAISASAPPVSAQGLVAAPPARRWAWFALPAVASVMLLATTNLLTQDVAPIPLLWVLPLSIYLLSFVFTFGRTSWYRRGLFHPLFALTALMTVITLFAGTGADVLPQIGIFLALLFAGCMVCHGELARIKPETRFLTSFYLTLSAGGAFGGIFVGLIAPLIFPAIWEYHLGLWATAALLVLVLFLDKNSWLHNPRPDLWIPISLVVFLCALPKYLAGSGRITIPTRLTSAYNVALLGLAVISIWVAFTGGPDWARRKAFRWYELTLAAGFLLLSGALYVHLTKQTGRLVHRERNFYGALSIRQKWDNDLVHSYLELMHGRITHGLQLADNRKAPTTYYGEKSGAGLALTTHPQRGLGAMHVGGIGLGVGTLASYARPGDIYRFYEINPAVIRLAEGEDGYFTFLKDSAAQIEIAPGDARLSLENEASRQHFQKFDVLVVDAFNGDSIPIHLLTREAMALYLAHLRGRDSILAVHVSNIAIDLVPVVASLANLYDLKATLVTTEGNGGITFPCEWILLTRGEALDHPEIQRVGKPVVATNPNAYVWSDDHSDVISLLTYRGHALKAWVRRGRAYFSKTRSTTFGRAM